MGRFDSYQQYLKYINPNTEQGRQMNRYTSGNYNPYMYSAPQSSGNYQFAQNVAGPQPINPLDYQYTPTALESTMQGLQYGKMGMDILGTKLGSKTLGQTFFPNMGQGAGATFANPLTQNVSAGSFTPQSAMGPQPYNPITGAEASGLTAGQQASNYFQNVGQGSVSAGLPMYVAGRLVRSAFDDDDPTTFTGGEMLGAGISGAGAGSALAGMLGFTGPGWLIGLGISLFGGKRKRDKARRAQKAYEKKIEERKEEIKEMYREGVSDYKSSVQKRSDEDQYLQMQSAYNNPYGGGSYYEEGGLTSKEKSKVAKMGRRGDTELAHINPVEADMLKFLGGSGTINPKTGLKEYGWFSNFVSGISDFVGSVLDPVTDVLDMGADVVGTGVDLATDVAGGALQATSDVVTEVGGAAYDVSEATGVTDVLSAAGDVASGALEATVVPLVETAAQGAQTIVDRGLDVVGDAVDFGFGMAEDVMGAIGNEIVFPVMEGVADFAGGILSGPDYEVPDLPPLQDSLPEAPIQDPNIVTVDPYTGRPITETERGVNFASGSMGFIGPEADGFDDYSAQQSTE